MNCKICNKNNFKTVIDLGNLYISNFISVDRNSTDYEKKPLKIVQCLDCDLVQLQQVPDLDSMYRQYWYKSSLNKSMIIALQDVASNAIATYFDFKIDNSHQTKDLVVTDIGANDGTLLELYKKIYERKIISIGFDPAYNIVEESKGKCDYFINDYFDASKYPINTKSDIVTAIACFYDLIDVNKFIKDVKAILDEDGIFVIQYTDLLQTLRIVGFDNFVHEHIELYSFKVLNKLMFDHGLNIFNVSTNTVNGGSIRAYICFSGKRQIQPSVKNLLNIEESFFKQYDFVGKTAYDAFKEKVEFIKEQAISFIKQENEKGRRIFVLGASTKGNTLLQYFGINSTMIPYAAEINEDKYGLKTIGSEIPIISEKQAFEMNPEYFLVLPWHFVDNFREKYKNYLNKGGKFIVFCPEFKIITNSWC